MSDTTAPGGPAAKATNKDIYETVLADGHLFGALTGRDFNRFEDTARFVRKDATSILDVGCFCGEWLNYVTGHLPRLKNHLGVDVAANKIAEAARRFPHLNLRACFAEELEAGEDSYDTVTCLEVLEHIPDWLSVFHSLFRFARKQVLITVPFNENIREMVCIHCAKPTPMWGHLRSYTAATFPDVPGWRKTWTKIKDRNPAWPFPVKVYRLMKPNYPWMLVSYERDV